MDKKPNNQNSGLTQREKYIIFTMGGLLLCVIVLFGGYILYDLNRSNPVALSTTSITHPVIQSENSPVPVQPSNTPKPQLSFTSTATFIPVPPTSTPPIISAPTIDTQTGTFYNPIPIGVGHTYPGLGTLTVLESSWLPSQTGFAIVKLSFTCERAADQECDLIVSDRFMLDALGDSGNGYNLEIDTSIPDPWFGSFTNPPLYGGGTQTGNVGFLITGNENTLLMRVGIIFQDGFVFFKLSN